MPDFWSKTWTPEFDFSPRFPRSWKIYFYQISNIFLDIVAYLKICSMVWTLRCRFVSQNFGRYSEFGCAGIKPQIVAKCCTLSTLQKFGFTCSMHGNKPFDGHCCRTDFQAWLRIFHHPKRIGFRPPSNRLPADSSKSSCAKTATTCSLSNWKLSGDRLVNPGCT